MDTVEVVLLTLLVLNGIALTVLVLLQQGKGADAGASFGAGASNTILGSSGSASLFTKLTAYLAIGFFVITFALAYTARERADAAQSLGIPQSSEQATLPSLDGAEDGTQDGAGEGILDAADALEGELEEATDAPEGSDIPNL